MATLGPNVGRIWERVAGRLVRVIEPVFTDVPLFPAGKVPELPVGETGGMPVGKIPSWMDEFAEDWELILTGTEAEGATLDWAVLESPEKLGALLESVGPEAAAPGVLFAIPVIMAIIGLYVDAIVIDLVVTRLMEALQEIDDGDEFGDEDDDLTVARKTVMEFINVFQPQYTFIGESAIRLREKAWSSKWMLFPNI